MVKLKPTSPRTKLTKKAELPAMAFTQPLAATRLSFILNWLGSFERRAVCRSGADSSRPGQVFHLSEARNLPAICSAGEYRPPEAKPFASRPPHVGFGFCYISGKKLSGPIVCPFGG